MDFTRWISIFFFCFPVRSNTCQDPRLGSPSCSWHAVSVSNFLVLLMPFPRSRITRECFAFGDVGSKRQDRRNSEANECAHYGYSRWRRTILQSRQCPPEIDDIFGLAFPFSFPSAFSHSLLQYAKYLRIFVPRFSLCSPQLSVK